MANDAPAASDQPAVSTPYLVRQPDGSTTTLMLHTSRQPTIGEVANYAESQGQAFAGFPEGPAAPSPPPAEAPSPILTNAPPEPPPTFTSRAVNVLTAPRRSLLSQSPAITGGAIGGMYGAEAGAPLGPVGIVVGGLTGAAIGAGGAEAAQYGAEQAIGSEPAEPGTFGQRVTGAAVRGAAGELLPSGLRVGASRLEGAVMPTAKAVAELEPIFAGTVATAAPKGAGAAEQLSSKYLLPQWWQSVSGRPPAEIVQAWTELGPEAQAAIAGEHLPAMQTVMGTIAQGAKGWTGEVGPWGRYGLGGAGMSYVLGHPQTILPSLAPGAWDVAQQVPPIALSAALRTPRAVPLLAGLPRVAEVAGPMIMAPVRTASQVYVAEEGPRGPTLVP